MSTDRINIAVLEEFIKKVRLSIKSGQREIKIPANEAENVCHNLHLISLKLLDKDIVPSNTEKEETISIVMDGGGFEEKR